MTEPTALFWWHFVASFTSATSLAPIWMTLWGVLREDAEGGWYVYAVGETPPSTVLDSAAFEPLHQRDRHPAAGREHKENYCGASSMRMICRQPSFVKIYDPNNLGVSCGYSDNPPLPGWVLSKIPPGGSTGNPAAAE